ncbi:MAG: hypothetical protein NC924_03595, partial [Candidatus Omnitrophica bacterium]|nr:hypothetical protein [Candidatus Omnitrophota bacterium]
MRVLFMQKKIGGIRAIAALLCANLGCPAFSVAATAGQASASAQYLSPHISVSQMSLQQGFQANPARLPEEQVYHTLLDVRLTQLREYFSHITAERSSERRLMDALFGWIEANRANRDIPRAVFVSFAAAIQIHNIWDGIRGLYVTQFHAPDEFGSYRSQLKTRDVVSEVRMQELAESIESLISERAAEPLTERLAQLRKAVAVYAAGLVQRFGKRTVAQFQDILAALPDEARDELETNLAAGVIVEPVYLEKLKDILSRPEPDEQRRVLIGKISQWTKPGEGDEQKIDSIKAADRQDSESEAKPAGKQPAVFVESPEILAACKTMFLTLADGTTHAISLPIADGTADELASSRAMEMQLAVARKYFSGRGTDPFAAPFEKYKETVGGYAQFDTFFMGWLLDQSENAWSQARDIVRAIVEYDAEVLAQLIYYLANEHIKKDENIDLTDLSYLVLGGGYMNVPAINAMVSKILKERFDSLLAGKFLSKPLHMFPVSFSAR